MIINKTDMYKKESQLRKCVSKDFEIQVYTDINNNNENDNTVSTKPKPV